VAQVCLTLQYDGTQYHGWQVQPNGITVQQVLQDAIQTVTGIRASVTGCSRTDSGVHARRFYCTTVLPERFPPEQFVKALNANLPRDIVVSACVPVEEDFHPRYSAVKKRYVYYIWNGAVRNPFWEKYSLHYRNKLDEKSMNETARLFVGTYDFSAFCSAGSEVQDKVRTIYRADIVRDGDLICFTIEGNGFLYNMVRIIVGTILEVETGKLSRQTVYQALTSGNRQQAGPTSPACGLFLDEVFYL
jgi:tRNA pseudouridine38-40 synthase